MLSANGHGLAMWRYLKIVSPEPQPNRITNDEDNNKSSIVKVKPGLLLISEQKVENMFVAPPYCQTACYVLPFLSLLLGFFQIKIFID